MTLKGQSEAELPRECPKADAAYHRRARELLAQHGGPTDLSPRDKWQAAVIAGQELVAGVTGFNRGHFSDDRGYIVTTDNDDRRGRLPKAFTNRVPTP